MREWDVRLSQESLVTLLIALDVLVDHQERLAAQLETMVDCDTDGEQRLYRARSAERYQRALHEIRQLRAYLQGLLDGSDRHGEAV